MKAAKKGLTKSMQAVDVAILYLQNRLTESCHCRMGLNFYSLV